MYIALAYVYVNNKTKYMDGGNCILVGCELSNFRSDANHAVPISPKTVKTLMVAGYGTFFNGSSLGVPCFFGLSVIP